MKHKTFLNKEADRIYPFYPYDNTNTNLQKAFKDGVRMALAPVEQLENFVSKAKSVLRSVLNNPKNDDALETAFIEGKHKAYEEIQDKLKELGL